MFTRDEPRDLCRAYGATPDSPNPSAKAGVALASLSLRPLNGLRHPPTDDTCGWYLWGGDLSAADDFFQPLHVDHLAEVCPDALRFLSLPAGWRFLVIGDHVDVWYDPSLLDVE